jgi:hypothetical protein
MGLGNERRLFNSTYRENREPEFDPSLLAGADMADEWDTLLL